DPISMTLILINLGQILNLRIESLTSPETPVTPGKNSLKYGNL
ncbi:unnamed protein product, partial [marine sediment metagenome]